MIVVIGAGVAGLSCALAAAATAAGAECGVELIGLEPGMAEAGDDSRAAGCNTVLAQGGIAAAIGPGDSPEAHLADTIAAGAGLVDPQAADVLVRDGAAALRRMLAGGFAADRDADGRVRLGLEAAHSASRIVHGGGDRSGAVLHAYLSARARDAERAGRLVIRGKMTAVSLIEDAGAVTGVVLRDAHGGLAVRSADAVVLATGGYAGLFPRTSNHAEARGEGIVLAARAGALVADLEFVQFHPTVLAGTGELVSEAVRGAGAVLRDGSGRRFMQGADPRAELAPRDVVSRAVHRTLRERGEVSVWLDARGIEAAEGPGALAKRFPGISAMLARHGYDWAREEIPVAPAAHYSMGGVASDLDGRSTVPGLLVAGEVSSTGVHGANRLASNSLLEGLVFGGRAGRAAAAWVRDGRARWEPRGPGIRALAADATPVRLASSTEPVAHGREALERAAVAAALETGLGIERDAHGLGAAQEALRPRTGPAAELAAMLVLAAAERTESRGAHQRADHPGSDPVQARRRAFRFSRPDASGAASTADTAASAAARSVQGSLTPC
ncbi:FAD-dependent oxidoreductase [Leucobacter sp. gxy201]|uniref:L-aspartate oxidase n=1 Tax=Leucobacter sp. gxy201 TaxID=2957200 RepID=UPI003D9FDDA6